LPIPSRRAATLVAGLALFPVSVFAQEPATAPAAVARDERPAAASERAKPTELFEVLRVVDGDTIHVRRHGEYEKLRLLSVDTEERLGVGFQGSATKPQTVFGEQCALWAQRFFKDLAGEDGVTRVGLLFPDGVEERDVYGRLLCHVILPDGRDFNLLLVAEGKSPYFNKYGNSRVCHEAFVAAQRAAQEARLGIWNPKTNVPATPDAPAARRPYERLLPWWSARAEAIDGYRRRHAEDPEHLISCEDGDALEHAQASKDEVLVFCSIDRTFEESNGDLTVRMRFPPDADKGLRVVIPHRFREAHETLGLDLLQQEFHQNYTWVRGRVRPGRRGPELVSEAPDQWRLAGPEPLEPAGTAEAASPAKR
jgi:endonuclease YncB( thermonuclease family)